MLSRGWVGKVAAVLVALFAIAAYAVPYAVRVRRLRGRGRSVPTWRMASFAGGLLVLAVATSSPLASAADDELTAHMIEHLLIGDIAPLLIVLGLTRPLIAPLLVSPRVRVLGHPVVAVAVWALDLYAWHLRVAYETAVAHPLVHVVQHACFFTGGALLWFALLGPLPKPAWFSNGARLAYVLVVRVVAGLLAYGFIWSARPFYPHYAPAGMTDQNAAGAVMLVEQSVLMVALFGWLLARTLRDAERRQQLRELAVAHGVALDERRIARAVASGQEAALMRGLTNGPGVG